MERDDIVVFGARFANQVSRYPKMIIYDGRSFEFQYPRSNLKIGKYTGAQGVYLL